MPRGFAVRQLHGNAALPCGQLTTPGIEMPHGNTPGKRTAKPTCTGNPQKTHGNEKLTGMTLDVAVRSSFAVSWAGLHGMKSFAVRLRLCRAPY